MSTTERSLSSPMTIYYKFVFPTLWLVLGSAAMSQMWGYSAPNPGGEIPVAVKVVVSVVWLSGVIFLFWFCAGLKKVRLGSGFLLVSGSFRTDRISIDSVAEVAEHSWINPIRVSIGFRTPTRFGQTITFIPKSLLSGTPHPVVQELRAAVERARAALPG